MPDGPSDTDSSPGSASSQMSPPSLTFSGDTPSPISEIPSDMNERVTTAQNPINENTTARCHSAAEGETYPNGQRMTSSPPPRTQYAETQHASSALVNWDEPGQGSPTPGVREGDLPSEGGDGDETMQDAGQQEREDETEEEESGN
jgi:hypothetical protein